MKQRQYPNLFWSTCLLLAMLLRSSKPSPTLTDQRIILQCLHNRIQLEMDLQDIPKLEPTSLHLRHSSCRPYQVTGTRAMFRVPFQGCGTTQETESEYIVYQNVVDNSQEMNATRVSVRHAPELRYPFACRYRQKYTLTLQEEQTKEQENDDGQGRQNSTKEEFPKDQRRPSSSVSCACLHYLNIFVFGLYLLL